MDYAIVLTISLRLTVLTVCSMFETVTGKIHNELIDSLNSRMLLMKDVAGYKAEHHSPVEDLDREAKVLTQSQCEAENYSLDPSSITMFVQAQMDVGKAIQYRFIADWLSEPESGWRPPRDLEYVRKNITDLDRMILQLISQQIREEDGFGVEQKTKSMERLNAPNIKAADKLHLINSLGSIKVRPSDVEVKSPYSAMCHAHR